jgi:TonB family protein
VSEIANADGETIGDPNAPTAKAYPLNKRNIVTEVFVDDGETLAVGGLMKQKLEEGTRKTAGLGDIPVLGMFFRNKTTKVGGGAGAKENAELFVTITPKVVNQPQDKPKQPRTPTQPAVTTVGEIDESLPEPLRMYSAIVQRRILDNLNYPQSAREAAFQGTVKLGLKLSYKGELLDVAVRSSSGYKILDDNAVYVARAVAPYPPFPATVNQKDLWVEIPIVYRLD